MIYSIKKLRLSLRFLVFCLLSKDLEKSISMPLHFKASASLSLAVITLLFLTSCGDDDNATLDNTAPTIEAQSFNVSEASQPGQVFATVVAQDAEEDELTFSITVNDDDLFAISGQGGLSVATGKSLDFETKNEHNLTVSVSDGEASATAEITINLTDVDENAAPELGEMSFTVAEDIAPGATIGALVATDADGDELTFSLKEPGAFDGLFSLGEEEGQTVLKLAPEKVLDYETRQSYSLIVTVSDGTLSAEGPVNVTVTDVNEAPELSEMNFTVAEDIAPGTTIGILVATDPDEDELTFSLRDLDTFEELFVLVEEEGQAVLKLAPGRTLDFETTESYTFTAVVTDGMLSAEGVVNVIVTDVDDSGFITKWETTTPDQEISIRINTTYTYNYDIDWGDGTIETGQTSAPVHTYASPGTYNVEINGEFPAFESSAVVETHSLLEVVQWGNIEWKSMRYAFSKCTNVTFTARDVPNLSLVTSMFGMFFEATSFNSDINSWDVSSVTNMGSMFQGATSFNQDLNAWNVSSVTNMRSMFEDASSFNGDVSSWIVSSAINMRRMFNQATDFNSDISSWNVGNVFNMNGMFSFARSFNQDLSSWSVGMVTDMFAMFAAANSFDQDLSSWDISSVSDMNSMFNSVGLSPTNYDLTLDGWSRQADAPADIRIGVSDLNYCDLGATARSKLISEKNWSFIGDQRGTATECQ